MRNLKRVLSLTLASVMLMGMMVIGSSAAGGYSDVDDGDNVEAIEVVQAVNIMTGDADADTFRPNDEVKRSEMARIMSSLLNYDPDYYAGTSPFTDMSGHWAEKYVAACYANGIVAGRTTTTYDPDATITAIEASAMMMRALGYFQYPGDYASGFEVATVRQGNLISIYDGLKSSATAPMTRNEVAQLALNTLQADVVEWEGSVGSDITTSDGTVINFGYQGKYNPVRQRNSDINYNSAKDGDPDKEYQQLAEKLYDNDLKKTPATNDAFGRPSSKWRYKNTDIGTYADKATVSYTSKVKIKDIYSDLGLSEATPINGGNGFIEDGETATVGDGYLVPNGTINSITKDSNLEIGATGVRTEVYYDTDKDPALKIVFINTYVGKIANVYSNVSDPYVVVEPKSILPGNTSFAPVSNFETTVFEEDDVVLYTYADGEIQTMALADKMSEQKVTGWTGNGESGRYPSATKLTADGQSYNVSRYAAMASDLVPDSRYDLYFDAFGNVIYTELYEGGIGSYAYVLAADVDDSAMFAADAYYAKLLFADGTVDVVVTDDNYSSKTINNVPGKDFEGKVVAYNVNDDDEYVLTSQTGVSSYGSYPNTLLEGGKAQFKFDGDPHYGNDSTVFVVATAEAKDIDNLGSAKFDVQVYTGIANAPKIDTSNDAGGVRSAAVYKEKGIAKYVFIVAKDGSVSSGIDEIIFVKGYGTTTPDIVRDGTSSYKVYTAYQNGERFDLKVDALSTENDKLENDVFLKNVTYNSKGIATSLTVYRDSGDIRYFNSYDLSGRYPVGTRRASGGSIGFGSASDPQWYRYSSDVEVYIVDAAGDVTVGGINSISDDPDDNYVAVVDDGMVKAIGIREVDVEAPDPNGDWKAGEGNEGSITGSSTYVTMNLGETLSVTFTNLVGEGNNDITRSWKCDDGGANLAGPSTGTGKTYSISVTPSSAGKYTIKVTATNTMAGKTSPVDRFIYLTVVSAS